MFYYLIGFSSLTLLLIIFLVNKRQPKKSQHSQRTSAAINRVIRTGITDDTLRTINSQLKK